MIIVKESLFGLVTKNTAYAFYINEIKKAQHLYYGRKIELDEKSVAALKEKQEFSIGNGISYSEEKENINLENMLLEESTSGHGDIRHPMTEIVFEDGSRSSDFIYDSFEIRKHTSMEKLPTSYGETEELVLHLKEKDTDVLLNVIYTVYEDCDVITRRNEIINSSDKKIKVTRLFSLQLDMKNENYKFISFHGSWIKEMKRYDQPIVIGRLVSESLAGVSSSRSNPFVMIAENNASENLGSVYGFNLIYSGNHEESVEADTYAHLRFLTGMHPSTFEFTLDKGEKLESPEAVMTYSEKGYNEMSHHMHDFVNNHIVRGEYQELPRPVLNNSWEAAYFHFNEKKLLKMAKSASKAGIELFVLDDGWFGTRNDDRQALGDWQDNLKKLPGGISRLSKKIQAMGMKFGIWVEPEMISEKSALYKAHPDWAVAIPGKEKSMGRHQMFLDLTRSEVVDYLDKSISDVFTRGEVSYVKWDMNRIFTDYFSNALPAVNMKEFSYRYYVGLYDLLRRLTTKFPHILFESCASGGNRFDLGMLCYMPQTWASDNSDAMSRILIQEGYSYGYPLSVLGCHVSDAPNHQTLRETTLDTRFNVAFFGCLGYEMNLGELSKADFKEVKTQIETYKKYRGYFLHSDCYRTESQDGFHQMELVSKNKEHAVTVLVQEKAVAGHPNDTLHLYGLDENMNYHLHNRSYAHHIRHFGGLVNQIAPIHIRPGSFLHKLLGKFVKMNEKGEDEIIRGDVLNANGYSVHPAFAGTGYNDKTRLMLDSDSRLYFFDKAEERK